jgi:hypothetical protein
VLRDVLQAGSFNEMLLVNPNNIFSSFSVAGFLLEINFMAGDAAKTACGRSADVWLFDQPMSLV